MSVFFFLVLNHHNSHLSPDLIGQQIQSRSECELIHFFSHKNISQINLSLKNTSTFASNVIAPFMSCSRTLKQGGCLPLQGLEFGCSGWKIVSSSTRPPRCLCVNITGDLYLTILEYCWMCDHSAHILCFLFLSWVSKLGLTLADIYYLNSIWHHCTLHFCLKQLAITVTASGSSSGSKFASGQEESFVWSHDSFLFGLCNIDVWLRQVGRHFDGAFASCLKSFSSDLFASLDENLKK